MSLRASDIFHLTFTSLCCTLLPTMIQNVMATNSHPSDEVLSLQVGQRIQQLREERGLSQRELAAQLCISFSRISRYEAGEREVPIRTLMRLAQIFGVPVDFLLPEAAADPLEQELQARVRRVLALRERQTAVLILDTLLGMWTFMQGVRPGPPRPKEI